MVALFALAWSCRWRRAAPTRGLAHFYSHADAVLTELAAVQGRCWVRQPMLTIHRRRRTA